MPMDVRWPIFRTTFVLFHGLFLVGLLSVSLLLYMKVLCIYTFFHWLYSEDRMQDLLNWSLQQHGEKVWWNPISLFPRALLRNLIVEPHLFFLSSLHPKYWPVALLIKITMSIAPLLWLLFLFYFQIKLSLP